MTTALAFHKASALHKFANSTYFITSALVLKFSAFFTLFCLLNKMNERVAIFAASLFSLRSLLMNFLLHICYSCEIRTNVEKTKRKGRGRSSVPQRNEQSATASGSGSRRWPRPQRVKQFDLRKRKWTRLRIESGFFSL